MNAPTSAAASITSLTERNPTITGQQIVASLVPPPQFASASFDGYRPDPDYPSQAEAVERLRAFARGAEPSRPSGFFSRRRKDLETKPGVYLDGGFGVGKTHLLASLWHAMGGRKYFGTFIEYTALVGALGFAETVKLLTGASLLCIDEFELDDPGDTMMTTRLVGELVATGTRIAATSNTPPNALGEGRFAASDFLREIHAMADHFETIRIDGLDYRRRDATGLAPVLDDDSLTRAVTALRERGRVVTVDGFDALIAHLSTVHPSRYILLIDGVEAIALTDVHQLHDQMEALRLVAFIDRAYDAQLPIFATGEPLSDVFDDTMLGGGYRKKYLRCISRLVALTSEELPPAS